MYVFLAAFLCQLVHSDRWDAVDDLGSMRWQAEAVMLVCYSCNSTYVITNTVKPFLMLDSAVCNSLSPGCSQAAACRAKGAAQLNAVCNCICDIMPVTSDTSKPELVGLQLHVAQASQIIVK